MVVTDIRYAAGWRDTTIASAQDKTRQGKARQSKAEARQDKARQGKTRQDKARQSKAEQRQRMEILSISDADWTQFQQTVKRPHCLILTQEIVGSKARRLRFLLMH